MRLFGHRGARGEAPENTVDGFRHARSVGLDAVEFDVRLTLDEQIVVIHDATVDRTTDGTGAVAELTLDELRALDARATFDEWPTPCVVPTLRETLDATSDFDALAVEIKADRQKRLSTLIPMLVEQLRLGGVADRVVLSSFDVTALAVAREVAPELPRAFIGNWDSPAAMTVARLVEAQQADMKLATSSAEMVAEAKTAGMRVVGWHCNTDDEHATLTSWGVDAATTDYPSVFLSS